MTVHPVSLQAAALGPEPADGLQAKFSIPYLTAYTLLNGPPVVDSFERSTPPPSSGRESIEVLTDARCSSPSSCCPRGGEELIRVEAALGSPQQPMDADALRPRSSAWRAPSSPARWTIRLQPGRKACSRWPVSP